MIEKRLELIAAEGLGKRVVAGAKEYNGWFGVGLGSNYYSEENLGLYAQWAVSHLKSFLFVVADDIEKYNLIVFNGSQEDAALETARSKADEKLAILYKIAERYPHRILIKRWQELSLNGEYQRIFNLLDNDYDKIPELKEHFDNTLWSNIRSKIEILRDEVGLDTFEKQFRVLVRYAIEEVASIIYFGEYHVFPIKIGHRGEAVYDNIVDRIYSKHYNKVHQKILPKVRRGNVYLQAVSADRALRTAI